MKRRRALALAGALVAVGGIGGAVALRLRPTDDLLARATQVADTSGWGGGQSFNLSIGIHWLSDQDVLFDRFEGPHLDRRVCYRRNLRTGEERRLDGLTAACASLSPERVDSEAVSPDGKWFLWSYRWGDVLLAEVTGARRYTYPSLDDGAYRGVVWFPDGQRWIERYAVNDQSSDVALHDVRHPAMRQSLSLGKLSEDYAELQGIRRDGVGVCVTSPNPFRGPANHPPAITIRTMRLGSPGRVLSERRIPIPHGVLSVAALLSPAGDRLALEVYVAPRDPMPGWMRRFLPFVRFAEERRTELWLCRLDGSGLHELGAVTEPDNPDDDNAGERVIWLDPQWLPSGKALSFEYRNALYTVPAD